MEVSVFFGIWQQRTVAAGRQELQQVAPSSVTALRPAEGSGTLSSPNFTAQDQAWKTGIPQLSAESGVRASGGPVMTALVVGCPWSLISEI